MMAEKHRKGEKCERLFYLFFGEGTQPEFSLLTPAHIAPIAAMLLVIWCIYRNRETLRSSKWEEKLRYALAFALIICDMSYYWRLVGMPSLGPICPSASAPGR